jgi:methylmalonyl-CoA/ethylmalonyl-CoA epimerase
MVVFNHIGYAVTNIRWYLDEFLIPLFLPMKVGEIIEDPIQQVRVAFVTLQGGVKIELIEPMTDTSPVSRILLAKRGGLYHLCYSVDNIDEEIKYFSNKGCRKISGPTPAAGFEGRRIAFLYTPQSDIIELVEQV